MGFYRKKPVVVEVFRTGKGTVEESLGSAFHWVRAHGGDCYLAHDYVGPYLMIETLEGTHRASVGDYIIKGVKGEFYPCKPDIFEMTYEPVTEG